ncbi:hypothetical protein PSYPI_36040, partial [Pseudomonas syringae pv. pisi str. 1704B]
MHVWEEPIKTMVRMSTCSGVNSPERDNPQSLARTA